MKRKPIMGLGILAVGAVLLITATFAARDLTQHTTSRVRTTIAQDNVILVEKFNPEDALDWKKHEVISKEIFVRNGQDTDDKEKYLYEDAYVRLQIKEYLEFVDYEYTYSEERLMVDAKGDFIKEASRADLETWMTTNEVPDDARIVELQGFYDMEPSFYIATQQGDVNGEYGVHLIVDRDDTNSQSIVVGQTNKTLKAIERHHDVLNDETVYTPHTWSNREYISYADLSNPISQFVNVGLGSNVITKEAWIEQGTQPIQKWILDTDSTEGWAYWGDKLSHDNTIENVESITSNLIESVELLNTLEGQAEYYNRISLDAVSFEDMSMWLDAPDEIFDAFDVTRDLLAGSRKKLQQLITIVEATDYQLFIDLNSAVNNAREVVANEEATEEELVTSYDSLKSIFDESMLNADSLRRNLPLLVELATVIEEEIDFNHFEGYASSEAIDFTTSLASSRALLERLDQTRSLGVSDEEIASEYDALFTAYNKVLALKPNYYQVITTSLSELIDETSSIVFDDELGAMRNDFYQALDSAQFISSDINSIARNITDVCDDLSKEYSALIKDENEFYKNKLSILLTEVNAYTFDVELGSLLTPYYDALNIANSVNGESSPTTVSLKDAYNTLKNTYDTLLIDENEYYKNNLSTLLTELNAYTFDPELGSLLTPYNNALNTANSVNSESTPTTISLKNAYNTLRNAFDTLMIDENDFYRGKLNDLIIDVQSVTFEQELGTMRDPFYDSLTSANQINSNSSSSTSSIQSALQSLSNTYNTLLTDENEFYKNSLSSLITEVSAYTFDAELGSILTPYNNALSTANAVNSESSPTTVSLKNARNTLNSTYNTLLIDENEFYKNSLSSLITQVSAYTFDAELGSMRTPYNNALSTANSVKNQNDPTTVSLKSARNTLKSTYDALVVDEKTFFRNSLSSKITQVNGYTFDAELGSIRTPFINALNTANSVKNQSTSTVVAMKNARDALNSAYNTLLTNENTFYKNSLNSLITQVNTYTFDAELGSMRTPYNNALSTANSVKNQTAPTTVSLKNARNTLKSTYDSLVVDENAYFRNSLSSKITQVNGYTFDTELGSIRTPFINALSTANSVKNQSTSTAVAMKTARDNLNSAYNTLLTGEKTFYKGELTTLIDKSNIKITEKLKAGALTQFNPIFSTSKATYNNSSSTGTQLKTARNSLRTAYNKLRLASDGPIPEGGKVLDFAGQDWVVLHEDGEGHALIALDRQLQVADFTKIGITPDDTSQGAKIKFHQTQTNYLPGGYETSKLKQTDVAFYNTFIKDHVDNDAVLPVEITQEVMITNEAQSNARTDAPTVINASTGTKTAFSLSVSDLNVYNVKIPRKLMSAVNERLSTYPKFFQMGLRSPGNSATTRMFIEYFFNVDNSFNKSLYWGYSVGNEFHVIPCMWITIGS